MDDGLTFISATELKSRLAEILNLVYYKREVAVVERYGRKLVKIVPCEENKIRTRLTEDYFGALPDFPAVFKTRRFNRRNLSL